MKKFLTPKSVNAVLSLIFICVLLLALSATAFTDDRITRNLPKFSDLPEGHWAYLHVMRLTSEEAITGYPDGTFKPTNNITRAEFLAVVVGALFRGRPAEPPAGQHWATNIIQSAEKNNLLEAGEFARGTWNNPINRQEMAKIMARGAQYVRKEALEGKTSVYTSKVIDFNSIPEAYRPYVAQAYAKGIVSGYPDGSFGGSKQATRTEAATMIVRLIDPLYRVAAETKPDEPVGRVIPFNPATDVAADGRMKLAKAEEYLMATFKTLRFYQEGGKFYFEGDTVEAPEGFRTDLNISVGFKESLGIPVASYSSYPSRGQKALPKSGPFTVELEGASSRDQIIAVLITLNIAAPHHTNTSYDREDYEVTWTISYGYDNRIEVVNYVTERKVSSKFYDLSTIFQW